MPFSAPFRRPVLIEADIEPYGRIITASVVDEFGCYLDTVGWRPEASDEWWCLNGHGALLGLDELLFAEEVGSDLFLVETPARWCAAATAGPWPGPAACILDWQRLDAVRLFLSLVGGVQCETIALARAVESALRVAPARQRLRIRCGHAL